MSYSGGELVVIAAWVVTLATFGVLHETLSQAEPRVSIRTETRALVCRVPQDPSNRWLQMGVTGYFEHGVQLNGLASDPISSRVETPDMGCEPGDVLQGFCVLVYGHGQTARATTNLSCPAVR